VQQNDFCHIRLNLYQAGIRHGIQHRLDGGVNSLLCRARLPTEIERKISALPDSNGSIATTRIKRRIQELRQICRGVGERKTQRKMRNHHCSPLPPSQRYTNPRLPVSLGMLLRLGWCTCSIEQQRSMRGLRVRQSPHGFADFTHVTMNFLSNDVVADFH
jgi:hypothetical protein